MTNRKSDRGFTLTEMLIVIGIIVLVVLIAIPSFKALTGGRSTEAAQNQISAVLARTRTEALGLQQPRGILFYRDLDTQRVGLVMVKAVNTSAPWELNLVQDRDVSLLPNDVGIQFVDNAVLAGTPKEPTDDAFIGFNTRMSTTNATNETKVAVGGLILFDGSGKLINDPFVFTRWIDPDGPLKPLPPQTTDMGKFLYNNPSLPATGDATVPTATADYPESKLGFVLFDDEAFRNTQGQNRTAGGVDVDTQVSGTGVNGTYTAEEKAEEQWLTDNGVPVLINRYNGTLVRAQ